MSKERLPIDEALTELSMSVLRWTDELRRKERSTTEMGMGLRCAKLLEGVIRQTTKAVVAEAGPEGSRILEEVGLGRPIPSLTDGQALQVIGRCIDSAETSEGVNQVFYPPDERRTLSSLIRDRNLIIHEDVGRADIDRFLRQCQRVHAFRLMDLVRRHQRG